MSLIISPLYEGSFWPFIISKSDDLGFANWPAIRPILTTGFLPPKVKTTAIFNNTLKVSLIKSAENSSKLSAQSPPCNKKAFPDSTFAKSFFRFLTSPANTSGGRLQSEFTTLLSWSLSS